MSPRCYWVYILARKPHGTLYIGVTNSLQRRLWEHSTGAVEGFTKRYGVQHLVHFEEFRDVSNAIRREKELKGWLRAKKIALIQKENPLWKDLAADWFAPVSLA
jgi:putative endonuclease